ncbi:MAG: hypothetical protein RL033_6615 [Pseudomonadota bacterium]
MINFDPVAQQDSDTRRAFLRGAIVLVTFAARCAGEVDTLQHHRQLSRVDLDVLHASCRGTNEFEGSGLEPLLHDTKTVSIPENHLRDVAASVEEDEQMATQWLKPELGLDQCSLLSAS